jgi:hypothetical protein
MLRAVIGRSPVQVWSSAPYFQSHTDTEYGERDGEQLGNKLAKIPRIKMQKGEEEMIALRPMRTVPLSPSQFTLAPASSAAALPIAV